MIHRRLAPYILIASVTLVTFFSGDFAQAQSLLRAGLYKLKGSMGSGTRKYEGQIVIVKEGTNFRVRWLIGAMAGQQQVGIGILEGAVFSIGYMDASGKDFGVVSMKVVDEKTLKGKWASIFSQKGEFGEEEFTFVSEKIPPELLPKTAAEPGGKKNI